MRIFIYFFYLFNRQGRLIRPCFGLGEGPNELLHPVRFQVRNRVMHLFDNQRSWFVSCRIDSMLLAEKPSYHKLEMPQEVTAPVMTKDSAFYFLGHTPRMIGYMKGKETTSFADYPEEFEHYDPHVKGLLFQGTLAMNPDCDRIVTASYNIDNLRFFRTNGDKGDIEQTKHFQTHKPLFKNDSEKTSYSIAWNMENRQGYNALATTPRYVYALYNGHTAKEERSYFCREVRVFDWEGNPVRRLMLPHDAWSIYVSEDDKQMWTISYGDQATDEPVRYYIYDL